MDYKTITREQMTHTNILIIIHRQVILQAKIRTIIMILSRFATNFPKKIRLTRRFITKI